MPIYERRCTGCGAAFSHLCNIEDRHKPKDCPNCDCPDTDHILSATPTDFKFADRSPIKKVKA